MSTVVRHYRRLARVGRILAGSAAPLGQVSSLGDHSGEMMVADANLCVDVSARRARFTPTPRRAKTTVGGKRLGLLGSHKTFSARDAGEDPVATHAPRCKGGA